MAIVGRTNPCELREDARGRCAGVVGADVPLPAVLQNALCGIWGDRRVSGCHQATGSATETLSPFLTRCTLSCISWPSPEDRFQGWDLGMLLRERKCFGTGVKRRKDRVVL